MTDKTTDTTSTQASLPDRPRPPAGRRLGDIVPTLPVVSKEDWEANGKRPFFVTNVSTFAGRYGESWRARVTDAEHGDMYIILLGTRNAVRDDVMDAIAAALTQSNMPVGPLVLAERRLASGRSTWEFTDAP
jgi:hypothetical protein